MQRAGLAQLALVHFLIFLAHTGKVNHAEQLIKIFRTEFIRAGRHLTGVLNHIQLLFQRIETARVIAEFRQFDGRTCISSLPRGPAGGLGNLSNKPSLLPLAKSQFTLVRSKERPRSIPISLTEKPHLSISPISRKCI